MASYTDYRKLSNRELLSLTLKEDVNSPVIDELLSRFETPRMLFEATLAELTSIKGMGPKKAARLLAALELGRRLYSTSSLKEPVIRSPKDIADLIMNEMRFLDREHFKVLLLNAKNRVLKFEAVSIGTLNFSTVHPRELFKSAIKHSAAAVILVHNHPSGDPTPSQEDIGVTRRLVETGRLLGIEVLDHVIIGDGVYVSFKEKGLL